MLIAYHNTLATFTMPRRHARWCISSPPNGGRALLLEYVFLEVVTVLRARRGLSLASSVGGTLLAAREIDFVPCSDLFLEALDEFRQQGMAQLSLVDAAILTVARRSSPGFIASFDDDFRACEGAAVIPDATSP
ncbi:MAG: type II toxin-antitoxin system VapC family toxin [Gemmatimonadaceae bacterium]|nr:type II toxin-antitoxin system VapC family toxin [Gemmatimonadaceae bacterium]